ncbi:MAG: hypothetical protein LBR10_02835 [Prevotellaceae bacterium]|jgi:hypothetical protein|nr:hypothetical protein [Prevotellaceae bacterium]
MQYRNGILLFLFELGFALQFNIVGTISLSELFLIVFSVFIINKKLFRNYPDLKKITLLYIGLLGAQIVSEVVVHNTLNNSLKGIAVTVVSYLHFIFLFRYFIRDRKYILYTITGAILCKFILGSQTEGSIAGTLTGEDIGLLKFYIAPAVINIVLVFSAFIKRKRISLIAIFTGGVLVILGTRSSGATLVLTGMVTYVIVSGKYVIRKKQLLRIAIVTVILGYGLYTIYVNEVLSGNITSGNSGQLLEIENPYNPIVLLETGRTEVFVGFIAFMDKFWFGHGAWALDETGKYHLLMALYKNKDVDTNFEYDDIIPAHSVLIGSGMYNGIFAFIFMLTIFIFFIKRGFKSLSKHDPYVMIVVSFLISLIWNGLFSPTSHFRISMPLYFATFLATYLINTKHNTHNENMFCNNR